MKLTTVRGDGLLSIDTTDTERVWIDGTRHNTYLTTLGADLWRWANRVKLPLALHAKNEDEARANHQAMVDAVDAALLARPPRQTAIRGLAASAGTMQGGQE